MRKSFRKKSDRHLEPIPSQESTGQTAEKSLRPAGYAALRLVREQAGLESVEPTIEAVNTPEGRPDILDIIALLNERCKETIGEDETLFKLEQAFLFLAQVAATDKPLEDIIEPEPASVENLERAYREARLYDGLDALRDAFEFARSDPQSGEHDQQNLVRFMKYRQPSVAWSDGVSRDLALLGIDEAYRLCQDAYTRYSDSVDGYLGKLQDILLDGAGLKKPAEDADEFEKRRFELVKAKLISEAWDDWNMQRLQRSAPENE